MKEHISYSYECEKCGSTYDSREDAATCEAEPMEVAQVAVGDYVATDAHWWWNADTSWTVSREATGHLEVSDKGWGKSPPGPFGPKAGRVFLPIWRIAAILPMRHEHRIRYILWCPRHANRGGAGSTGNYAEAIDWTTLNHKKLKPVPESLRPVPTREEDARFTEVAAMGNYDRIPLL